MPWTKPDEIPYANNAAPMPELGGLFPDVFHAVFADGHIETLWKKYNANDLRALIICNDGAVMDFDMIRAYSAAAFWRRKNRQLQQNLEEARERLRLLQEERDVLRGRPLEKSALESDALVDELKKENTRLQKELEKVDKGRSSLWQEILDLQKKSLNKKAP